VKNKTVSIFLGLLFAVGCACTGLSNRTTEKDAPERSPGMLSPDMIAEIEKYGRLTMPATAQNVEFYLEPGGIDAFVALKFEIPADEFFLFLEQAGYTEPLERAVRLRDIRGLLYPLDEWNLIRSWPTREEWEQLLQDSTKILMFAKRHEPGFSRNVVVDQTNPELYIVYLVHHEL
jgi:hypothetical protein